LNTVLWSRVDAVGLEACRVRVHPSLTLHGTVVMPLNGTPSVVTYRVETDAAGITRSARIALQQGDARRRLSLRRDAHGHWTRDGDGVASLDGLADVDIGVTPSTNTLPLRRLHLPVGSARVLTAVWIRLPKLTTEPLTQRYTRLAARRYRYESLASGFAAELSVDDDGVVVDYEGVWRRLASGAPPE
jgi:hypothetical protein